jgi:predicted aspartyl protease
MMRRETPFNSTGDLIIVSALVEGPLQHIKGWFALDTGAAMTTIRPELARDVGYDARDAVTRTTVRSAIGVERGYAVRVAGFSALHVREPNFLVNVFELGFDDLDGLIGTNFLGILNYDIRSVERRILVERALR